MQRSGLRCHTSQHSRLDVKGLELSRLGRTKPIGSHAFLAILFVRMESLQFGRMKWQV